MVFSIKRVNALFTKEIKDFTKNLNVFFLCFLPIFTTLFTNTIQESSDSLQGDLNFFQLSNGLSMNLVLVGISIMAIIIAEEKEKNTMRTLMLSGVSPFEFLAGKALLVFFITTINNVAIFFIVGVDTAHLMLYLVMSSLVVITMILLGSIVGLLSPNQMATGVLVTPVALLFITLPMIAEYNINDFVSKIALSLPNYNLQLILGKLLTEQTFSFLSKELAIIFGWIALSSGIFAYYYKKKGLDK